MLGLFNVTTSTDLLFIFVMYECHGLKRTACKEIANMDLFEEEFLAVVVTGN